MLEIVLASGNRGKAAEFEAMLRGLDVRLLSLGELFSVVPSIPETGATFEENALQKAAWVRERYDGIVLADDSGLEVDALGGAPGVYSARFAGEDATDAANVEKLLQALAGVAARERKARFRCVLVLLGASPRPVVAHGVCDGIIGTCPCGSSGFGYDPVFVPNGFHQSFAQMEPSVKSAISHRGKAVLHLRKEILRLNESRHRRA